MNDLFIYCSIIIILIDLHIISSNLYKTLKYLKNINDNIYIIYKELEK